MKKEPISVTHPALVEEWAPTNMLSLENMTAGSGQHAEWVCRRKEAHVWSATIKNRAKGSGCPYCAGKKVLVGDNDLAATHPLLVSEWSDENLLKVTEVTAGSNKKVHWVCNEDNTHKWTTSVTARTRLNSGCPYCAGQKALSGVNDLSTTHPELAKEWHHDNTLKLSEISAHSNKKAKWQCSEHESHQWDAIIGARAKGSGCPYCSGRKAFEGVNDLATTHPHLVKEWGENDRAITSVSAGSEYKAQWKCEKGHTWACSVYSRTKLLRKCDVCNNRKLLIGYNDVATTHSHLVKEWSKNNTLSPSEVITGSSLRVEWVCQSNPDHTWKTMVGNRTKQVLSTGCPHCYAQTFVSKGETEVYDYIRKLIAESGQNTTVRQSARGVIPSKELDIYLPELNFAVEYNGLYWHSETTGKDKWYHYEKYRECKDRGIKLFQVWEDDYIENKDLIESMIAHQLNVSVAEVLFARNTLFVKVSKHEAEKFLSANHLQGMNYASTYYGLRCKKKERLVALLGLQRKGVELEISRFATGGRVTGAFSKLLKNALTETGYARVQRLISYSHNDHSWGEVYAKNGFTKVHDGTPSYFYFSSGNLSREFRRSFTVKNFRNRKDLLYEEGLTERELAALNGLHRIWDSGSSKWVKELSSAQ